MPFFRFKKKLGFVYLAVLCDISKTPEFLPFFGAFPLASSMNLQDGHV